MGLPSGYKPVDRLWSEYRSASSTNAYFDTGIVPKSTLKLESLFRFTGSSGQTFYFGARNTNSDTSVGQLCFGTNTSMYPIVGYRNATSVMMQRTSYGGFFGKTDSFLYNHTGDFYAQVDASGNAFTGTRNMFVLARNNAGNVQWGGAIGHKGVDVVKIWDGDTLIAHFVPAYQESSSTFGLYDLVTDTFITKAGGTNGFVSANSMTVLSAGNGDAYIMDERLGKLSEILISDTTLIPAYPVRIKAEPNDGYIFSHWEKGGVKTSTDADTYVTGEATSYVAIFIKGTTVDQYNGFRAMAFQYGANAEGNTDPSTNTYAKVIKASIREDIMQKCSSSIELENAEGIDNNAPIILTNALNKKVFIGTVKSIDGNVVEAGEVLSITDNDFLMNYPLKNYSAMGYVNTLGLRSVHGETGINPSGLNPAMYKKGSDFFFSYNPIMIHQDGSLNYLAEVPWTNDVNVVNAEDVLLDVANNYMISVETKYVLDRENYGDINWTGQGIYIYPVNPLIYSTLVIGNNSEEISDISIQVEEAETTVLEIYTSNGATFRGRYGVKEDGTIAEMPMTSDFPDDLIGFVARYDCKMKLVNSDDPINSLVIQNLSNSFYNHQISFNVDLSKGSFRFDDFNLCRPVNFYYDNRMYKSVITAREYEIEPNDSDLRSMKITLGKVRTTLTSLLNLKR